MLGMSDYFFWDMEAFFLVGVLSEGMLIPPLGFDVPFEELYPPPIKVFDAIVPNPDFLPRPRGMYFPF
jgi:hypothetical protein